MIIQGDCIEELKKLPSNSIDSVVTDPPYCSGGFNESQKMQATGQGLRSETRKRDGWFICDNMTTGGLVWLLRAVSVEAFRVLKEGGSFCVFADWRMYPQLAPALESSGFRLRNMIVWNKGSMGLGTGFRPQHEIIIHLTKGKTKFYDRKTGNVITEKRVSATKRLHQTEKPVNLLSKLIRVTTPPGGTVLDPFAGSGTTGVAAKQEGFDFILIERDPEYIEIARERLGEPALI